jgi:putative zinc finger/helix-turn-helix YgiT family protein
MKSPYTGKEMLLKYELRVVEFRKEEFEIAYHYYLCTDSGEQFTDSALDEYNLRLLYNQYRAKNNIPFPEEIKGIREKYALSAAKMSKILGFGPNTYRQYEAGEVPNISNSRLLTLASNPNHFYDLVKDLWETENRQDKDKVIKKIQAVIDQQQDQDYQRVLWVYFLGSLKPEIETGYRTPNIKKFAGMVHFFAEQCHPYKTKLNKLLFYADFLMFKETGRSVSGVRYAAIDFGPVPNNFQSIYEYLSNKGLINIRYTHFKNGKTAEEISLPAQTAFDKKLFNDHELNILKRVAKKFQNSSTTEIIKYSHLEKAWTDHIHTKSIISYQYAFDLKPV